MLELLREADMILDACGRPTPPPGYRFVDLPRCIPFAASQTGGGEGPSNIHYPYANRVENTSKTLFLCRGISTNTSLRFQVKWPNGRFFNQTHGQAGQFIQGTGQRMYALLNDQPVASGERITVNIADVLNAGVLRIGFWGVLRYLLKDATPANGGRNNAEASCLVGYPAEAQNRSKDLATMLDPIRELAARPRYWCGPNQNIMAPEWMLGNQKPNTPAGYEDEPFTFFSDEITCGLGVLDQQQLNNSVLIPGGEDVIVRGVRQIVRYVGESFAWPVFSIRRPDGWSVMGGDQIPQISAFQWLPFYPPMKTRAGERIIIDVGLIDVSGTGSLVIKYEFQAVKRRKVS